MIPCLNAALPTRLVHHHRYDPTLSCPVLAPPLSIDVPPLQSQFVDKIRIVATGGKGGDGCISLEGENRVKNHALVYSSVVKSLGCVNAVWSWEVSHPSPIQGTHHYFHVHTCGARLALHGERLHLNLPSSDMEG